MNLTRKEILPGVFLNHLETGKFKTACLSISLLTQLSGETASMNALIPHVLCRGTSSLRDLEALSNRLDELYGTEVEPLIRKSGEIQSIGLYASFPEEKYLPEVHGFTEEVISLVGEMLLNPATRGGLFLPDYVESEKEKLADLIRSRINDKRSYALSRCAEEMCCFEDYSVNRLGSEEACRQISYKKLTRHYRKMLQVCPVEIIYCGSEGAEKIEKILSDALCTLPRGEIDWEIGTDIRMNSVEEEVRLFEERLSIGQGKLVMGYRLGECMLEPDIPAQMVFNCVFGSGVTSKLFMNVREKLSLCYYASSLLDKKKGLMFVQSGIDFDRYEAAVAEIGRQLDDVRLGNISEEELKWAVKGICSDLSAVEDSLHSVESFWFSNIVSGLDWSPKELAELVLEVKREDVSAVAKSIVPDLIYFLRNNQEGEEEAFGE